MKIIRYSLLLLTTQMAFITALIAQTNGYLPSIKYKEITLKNGLRVIMHEDKSTPVVAVSLFYHVGSKNEAPGRTGFAHLFEHMMFQGSKNFVDGWRPVYELGGSVNGTTNEDRTYYYETVPSNYLERALYLEADRMSNLLDAMTQEKLDNQRDVVKNERRQRVDNQPYGSAFERIGEIMYPEGHPYHWSIIGSMEDISAASMDDIKSFFRTYYVPNNAVLTIAGDFDEKQTRMWIEKYFGSIARGADIKRPAPAPPQLSGEIRKTYEENVPLPRLTFVWHTVPHYDPDEAALDMLSWILTTGRGARLQSNLVYGKELTQSINAYNPTSELAGTFQIVALAKPNKSLDEIEKEIDSEIERIKKEAPTAEEIKRAFNIREADVIFGLETVLSRAGQLSTFAGYGKKPDSFQSDLDRYRKVTAADIQRVANKYLNDKRLVMRHMPLKATAPKANPNASQPVSAAMPKKDESLIAAQEAKLPPAGAMPKFSLPAIEKTKLSNGLNVWLVKQDELPIVSLNLVTGAGGTADSADKNGVAWLTANLINKGTKLRSAIEIANSLQSIGASINTGITWDSSNLTMQILTKNFDQALDIYSDVIVNPSFPADEFESTRRRMLVGFVQRKSVPAAVGDLVFNKVVYGDQPYGRSITGDESSIKSLSREDLLNFYQANYRPNNATLIVVGAVDNKILLPKLEKAFADWRPSEQSTTRKEIPQTMQSKGGIYIVDKPNAPQSSVYIGQIGVERNNPDYYAVYVMNSILGGGSTGRLFQNLRQDKGYTYGAYSRFDYRRAAGPFTATAEVQTVSTKDAVAEFIKEFNGIRGAIPVTPRVLDTTKQAIIRGFPNGFETAGQINYQLSNLIVYGLPDDTFNNYITKINQVTSEDVNRVANKYLTPDKMSIIIVGDRKSIEPALQSLGYPITILDADGNTINP
jgi:zinc protease